MELERAETCLPIRRSLHKTLVQILKCIKVPKFIFVGVGTPIHFSASGLEFLKSSIGIGKAQETKDPVLTLVLIKMVEIYRVLKCHGKMYIPSRDAPFTEDQNQHIGFQSRCSEEMFLPVLSKDPFCLP